MRIQRLEPERRPKLRFGLREFPLQGQDLRQVGVGVRIVRVGLERGGELFDGGGKIGRPPPG